MILSNLAELAVRLIKWDKTLGVQINGEANDYPERMERYKDNSVTALMASDKMFKFVIGRGLGTDNDKIMIGKTKLIDILDDICHDIVDDRGVFIHVRYNRLFKVHSFKVLTYKDCRVGELDDSKYNGKILVYDNWAGKVNKDKVKVYDVFNPDPAVVEAQIKKAKSLANYKGQVLFYNMDRGKVYPLSRIHAVWTSCDAENLAGIYKQRILKYGFFGKTLLITRKLISQNIYNGTKTEEGQKILHRAEDEKRSFQKNWKKFIGAEDVGEALHMEVDVPRDADLDKEVVVKQIESKIDDKMFESTENSTRSNILMAYNNLPEMLVKSNDAVFGQNGTGIKEAKLSYQESTEKERSIAEQLINQLYKLMDGNEEAEDFRIIELIEKPVTTAENPA